MPGLYFHCGQLLGLAREARDRAGKAVEANAEAWPSDAIVSIVLAAASAEAFINELTELMAMTKSNRDQEGRAMPPLLAAFADTLTEVEESRGSTTLKYLLASQVLGKRLDKGRPPYQDFALLMTLRNDLMHLKPRDTFDLNEDRTRMTVRWPKYIVALQNRGLARTVPEKVIASWFELLKTEQLARWGCDTAVAIILAILSLIPDAADDPAQGLKFMFRRDDL
jgi:hypothetical protein